jgi:PAS domain S-box-containing protein
MDLIYADTNISPGEVSAALRNFPVAGDTPLLGQAGAKVLFASRAMLNLFGAHDLAELATRLRSADPGARRLGALAARLPVDGAPRLERLRFMLPPAAEMLTFVCRRLARDPEPLFMAIALNVRPALLRAPPPKATTPADDASRAEAATAATVAAAFAERGAPRRVRFLWRTDAADIVTDIGPELATVVGDVAAAIAGHEMGEAARTLALDPSGALAAALAGRESWSGVHVAWPVTDAAATVAATLGAVPERDSDGAFLGYRGFGILDLDRVNAGPALCLRPKDPAPEPEEAALVAPDRDAPAPAETPSGGNVVPLRPQGSRPAPEPVLSDSERSAFDQIAFLLSGAEPDAAETPAGAEAAPDAAARIAESLLDLLDTGVIVARDDAVLFANRAALALTGPPAGSVAILLEGLARATEGAPVRADVRPAAIDWPGGPADVVMLQREAEPQTAPPEPPPQLLPPPPPPPQAETRELKTILDTAMDGVVVLDGEGRIVSLNRSGEALFGCDQAEVLGAPFTELIAADSQTRVRDYLAGLKAEGVASLLNDGREIVGRTRQGGLIPMFVTLGRISAHDDPAMKFCALLRDLTQWKKVERELNSARQEAERTSALKSDFLAKISHEIRTPLNAILGFAEVIMDERLGPIGNERYRDYLKDIHASGQHVMSLVNDLLDLSKIESGKMELTVAPVDANQVIGECVSLMQTQASRERVIMRLSLAQNLPQVLADARSLKQIVLNLLSNAIKFNEPGGQVIVATTLTDTGHAVIRVRDTGIGMSDEEIELALEPFRQVATSRPTSGTGLGLPLTKALVEANSAYFEIKSRPKEGTLVEVVFPPAQVLAPGEAER